MDALIDKVLNFNKILWLNFGCETRYDSFNSFPWIDPGSLFDGKGLDQICLLMASKDDYFFVRRNIPRFVREGYLEAGFQLPHISIFDKDNEGIYATDLLKNWSINLKLLSNYTLFPFGISKTEEEFANKVNLPYFGISSEISQILNSKINLRKVVIDANIPVPEGYIAYTNSDADLYIKSNIHNYPMLLKTEYGASGIGIFSINSLNDWLFIKKRIERRKISPLLIERRYDVAYSFNYQILSFSGVTKIVSIKKQVVNKNLGFIGCDWSKEIIDYSSAALKDSTNLIIAILKRYSIEGIVNVDGFVSVNGDIFPIIDLNARFSLTSYFTFSKVLQNSPYNFFRFRYYSYFSESEGRLLDLIHKYRFLKSSPAIFVCCCDLPPNQKTGRIGILFLAWHEAGELDEIEDLFLRILRGIYV